MSSQIERNKRAEELLKDIGIIREVPRTVKDDEIYSCGNAQSSIIEIKNGKRILIKGKPCPLNKQLCVKVSNCGNVTYQKNLDRIRSKARLFEDGDWQALEK